MQKLILLLMLFLISILSFSQTTGSGKSITKTYPFKDFDKVYFEDLDGKLEVEIGQPFSITVSIDDNLQNLLSIAENQKEHQLTIAFKNNQNNRQYIENTKLRIRITMPEASVISNNGNSNLDIRNVIGRYFRIENTGNGDTRISGSIDSLDIEKMGNGDILTEKLIAKKANIKSTGNGNVTVNVSNELKASLKGNGDIKNVGAAAFDPSSSKTGNGSFIKSR